MSSSRRMTREYLLQSLYARSEIGESFHQMHFYDAFFRDEVPFTVDETYFQIMENAILQHEKRLLGIINTLAPKFDLSTMPVIHILILMIALAEMLYAQSLNIPESVSINEAIELAKKFSDDHGKAFVNGTLSSFMKTRDMLNTGETFEIIFSIFHK